MRALKTTHYATVPETAAERRKHRESAAKQELQVLAVFKAAGRPLAPHEVWDRLNTLAPITSIRRAISNLTLAGELEKTDRYTTGPEGRRVHLWQIARPPAATQLGLWEE